MKPDLPDTFVNSGTELVVEWTQVDIGFYFDLETGPSTYDYRFLVTHRGAVKAGPILASGDVTRWWHYDDLATALFQWGWRIVG